MSIFGVRAGCEIQFTIYGSKHTLQSLSDMSFSVLTQKSPVEHRHSTCTYKTTAMLLEMSIFWVRAGHKLQMISYGLKHKSKPLSDKPFVSTYTHKFKTAGYI